MTDWMSDPFRAEAERAALQIVVEVERARVEAAEAEVAALRTELARVSEKLIQALARERAALAAVAPPEYEYDAVGYRFTHATSDGHLMRGCPPIMPPEQTWEPVFVRRVAPQANDG